MVRVGGHPIPQKGFILAHPQDAAALMIAFAVNLETLQKALATASNL